MFKLDQVTLTHHTQPLFDTLSTSFSPKEVVLINGVNGIGKTTLLRAMLGLHPVFSGMISWKEQSIATIERYKIGTDIGYLHQQPSYQLFGMSVWQECTLFSSFRNQVIEIDYIEKLLDQLNLLEIKDQHPQLCSRGQQQRLGFALALIQKPTMILLDEPTTALDDEHVAIMVELIQQHQEFGWVIVSHDPRLQVLNISKTITLTKSEQYETT